jgi:hypothetical protein
VAVLTDGARVGVKGAGGLADSTTGALPARAGRAGRHGVTLLVRLGVAPSRCAVEGRARGLDALGPPPNRDASPPLAADRRDRRAIAEAAASRRSTPGADVPLAGAAPQAAESPARSASRSNRARNAARASVVLCLVSRRACIMWAAMRARRLRSAGLIGLDLGMYLPRSRFPTGTASAVLVIRSVSSVKCHGYVTALMAPMEARLL